MANIQAAADAMVRSWNDKDLKGLMTLISDDFKYTDYSKGLVGQNKADWQEHLSKAFATPDKHNISLRSVKGAPELFVIELTGKVDAERNGQPFSATFDAARICTLNAEGKFTKVSAYSVYTPTK